MDLAGVLLLVALISALGAVAQSATGTGYGVVAAPLLVLVEPATVPGPLLVSTILVMSIVVGRHRAALALRDLAPALLGAVPGVVVGFLVVAVTSAPITMFAVGAIVLLGALASLTGVRLPETAATLTVAGAVAGAFTVIAATPGPPLAIVYHPADVHRLRATLSAFFLVSSAATLAPLLVLRGADWPPPIFTIALCVGVAVGAVGATPVLGVLSARTIRICALTLCVVAGITLVVRSAFEFAGT